MESIDQFSKRVVASYQRYSRSEPDRAKELALHVKNFLVALFKAIKTINEAPEPERTEMIVELETVYGIPKTHIL